LIKLKTVDSPIDKENLHIFQGVHSTWKVHFRYVCLFQ